jgi:hypothetical protein
MLRMEKLNCTALLFGVQFAPPFQNFSRNNRFYSKYARQRLLTLTHLSQQCLKQSRRSDIELYVISATRRTKSIRRTFTQSNKVSFKKISPRQASSCMTEDELLTNYECWETESVRRAKTLSGFSRAAWLANALIARRKADELRRRLNRPIPRMGIPGRDAGTRSWLAMIGLWARTFW